MSDIVNFLESEENIDNYCEYLKEIFHKRNEKILKVEICSEEDLN